MFQVVDCFLKSGVFNDALIKRFKDNYDARNGSRLWMIPGHVIYTTPDQKVYTCDARPLDLLSPSEPCTGELLSSMAPLLDIFFESDHDSLRMYIALSNGDIQIFEYRSLLYEWARVGYFNVNITSPNNSVNQQYMLSKVFISQQNKIYWCEKDGLGDMNLTLFSRSLPLNSVREITQTALGDSQSLLKSCPDFEIFEVGENICILPKLPNSVNLYLILSARLHLWVFDITGKCLWRGVITEQSMDFITLCMKIAGLWSLTGTVKYCKTLYHHHKVAYLLHDKTLLKITSSGEITSKNEMNLSIDSFDDDIYVLWSILCVVTKESLMLYGLESGKLLQTISLENYMPIRGIWSHASVIPCLGFYTDSTAFMIQTQSLSSILSSEEPLFSQVVNVFSNKDVHLYALMKDLVHDRLSKEDLLPLQSIPTIVQSKALLLALFHLCKSKGIDVENFPFDSSCQDNLFNSQNTETYPNTKLKETLEPLVQCFCKIEEARKKL